MIWFVGCLRKTDDLPVIGIGLGWPKLIGDQYNSGHSAIEVAWGSER
jgi:hypothetical protein